MPEIYDDKEFHVIVNQSVNQFWTHFLLKTDSLSQGVLFPLKITVTFFNNLISDII